MSVLYDDVQKGQVNSQECKSFEIDAVTVKKSLTEYHHWINGRAHHFILIQYT